MRKYVYASMCARECVRARKYVCARAVHVVASLEERHPPALSLSRYLKRLPMHHLDWAVAVSCCGIVRLTQRRDRGVQLHPLCRVVCYPSLQNARMHLNVSICIVFDNQRGLVTFEDIWY